MLRLIDCVTNCLFVQLVAGSGATEESDEKDNAPAGPGGVVEIDVAKGSTEGIPGPITRLFVLANRGIANLIQDLILVTKNRIASLFSRRTQNAIYTVERNHCFVLLVILTENLNAEIQLTNIYLTLFVSLMLCNFA